MNKHEIEIKKYVERKMREADVRHSSKQSMEYEPENSVYQKFLDRSQDSLERLKELRCRAKIEFDLQQRRIENIMNDRYLGGLIVNSWDIDELFIPDRYVKCRSGVDTYFVRKNIIDEK